MADRKNIPDEKFVALHSEGFINAEIARALKIKASAVSYRMKKLGLVPNRAHKPAPLPAPSPPPQPSPDIAVPDSNGNGALSRFDDVTLGKAIEDLLRDIDGSRREVINDQKLTEKGKIAAFKDVALTLKTIEGTASSRLALHDAWTEQVIKSFVSFAERVESALARRSEQGHGRVSMSDIMDVLHEESLRLQKVVQEFYVKETEGLHR